MPTLFVTDRPGAEQRLAEGTVAALVSCHDPTAGPDKNFPPQPCNGFGAFPGPKIAFGFADSAPGEWQGEHAATLEDIESLVQWGRDHAELEGTVLVHCNAGVGRSPAVAFILQCLWDGVTIHEERSLAAALKGCTTGPMPNEHVTRLGDQVLDRDRSMIWTVQVFNDALKGAKMY